MFRKSVFIMLFVCLLATISSAFTPSANYPWDGQVAWNTDNTDANWYEATNWTPNSPAGGPGLNNDAVIMPMVPGPVITGDANASMLMYNGWDPTSYGPKDANVEIGVTAGNCNFGATIQLNSWSDYDSYLGTANILSRAILNVYGGTVTTPTHTNNSTNLSGLHIGGGASNSSNAYGLLNMYGGEVNVPRFEIYFGDVNLYGGTLMVNAEPNFIISPLHPNRFNMNGGTLIVAGDHTADFNADINDGHFFSSRGTLGTPTYNSTPDGDGATWTTLTSTGNYMTAWGPQPASGAGNIHYNNGTGTTTGSVTLTWNKGDFFDANGNYITINHIVYFGTSAASLTPQTSIPDADPNNDPCSWTVTGPFSVGATYYWEVNEFNTVSGVNTPGPVWNFTTHDGKTYNPNPQNGQNYLKEPLTLSWTAGDWAASTNGHKVYFGTSNFGTLRPSAPGYRGLQTGTTYPLGNLAGDFTLTPGNTYYWCVDEVNGSTTWKGPVWSFTPAQYINIDDFEDYNSTFDMNGRGDANAGWSTGYTVYRQNGSCSGVAAVPAKGLVTYKRDTAGKHMNFTYIDEPSTFAFSEANRPYIGGTVFSGSSVFSPQPAVIRVDYIGASSNAVDPCDDRMYIALEDTAGNIGVKYNPDPNAAQATTWQTWYIPLSDGNLASVNMAAVDGFRLGFGSRLGCMDNEFGGDGNVMFDNIRLYGKTCNAAVADLTLIADMDGDCDVDINDLDIFANDWLVKAEDRTFATITAPAAPILWYKFNETGTTTDVCDWGTGDANYYTGTVMNPATVTWQSSLGRSATHLGCIYLPPGGQNTYVNAPATALSFVRDATHSAAGGGGLTFSVWINADMTSNSMLTSWNGLFGVWGGPATPVEQISIFCPTPQVPPVCAFLKLSPSATANAFNRNPIDFGGRWNHYAFVKGPNTMQIYINGDLAGRIDANGQPGDPNVNVYGPLFDPNVTSLGIGTRSSGAPYPNWGMWNGYLQDFQVYDYALSAAEVAYLATDGTGEIKLPINTKANIYLDGGTANDMNQIVNFEDLSVMGIEWHTIQLWP